MADEGVESAGRGVEVELLDDSADEAERKPDATSEAADVKDNEGDVGAGGGDGKEVEAEVGPDAWKVDRREMMRDLVKISLYPIHSFDEAEKENANKCLFEAGRRLMDSEVLRNVIDFDYFDKKDNPINHYPFMINTCFHLWNLRKERRWKEVRIQPDPDKPPINFVNYVAREIITADPPRQLLVYVHEELLGCLDQQACVDIYVKANQSINTLIEFKKHLRRAIRDKNPYSNMWDSKMVEPMVEKASRNMPISRTQLLEFVKMNSKERPTRASTRKMRRKHR